MRLLLGGPSYNGISIKAKQRHRSVPSLLRDVDSIVLLNVTPMWAEAPAQALTCVTAFGYRCITRNYMGCHQKIEKLMSLSLSYCNSSKLFQSCAE